MTFSPELLVQVIPQCASCIDRHGEANANAALIHLSPELRKLHPADDTNNMFCCLDGRACDVDATDDERFGQRRQR